MGNYIHNCLTITGADAAEIASRAKSSKRCFDFDRIVPMPIVLATSKSNTDAEYGLIMLGVPNPRGRSGPKSEDLLGYRWVKEAGVVDLTGLQKLLRSDPPSDDYQRAGSIAAQCIAETGYANWYDWRIDHWGTKWNAFDSDGGLRGGGEAKFSFRTAWDPPLPIIGQLSIEYPTSTFLLDYCDASEDAGGVLTIKNGTLLQKQLYDSNDEIIPSWDELRPDIDKSK